MGIHRSLLIILATQAILLAGISLPAYASDPCAKGFQALQASPRTATTVAEAMAVIERENARMREKATSLSFAELTNEANEAIKKITARDGYLPGCDPGWNPANVDELIENFRTHPSGSSMLHQTVANLTGIDTFLGVVGHRRTPPRERDLKLFGMWEDDGWHLIVFRELQKRLTQELP